jgi:hypothetical protein
MNSLDRTLEWMVTREVDEVAVSEAQRELEALIASRARHVRPAPRARGWLAVAASAAVLAIAMIWLPLAPTPALAFSAVQQNLRDFRTLRFVMDQRVNGRATMQTRVAMSRDGNVRTEVGEDITVIVNSAEQRVLTLMKSRRIAMLSPLQEPVEKDDQLSWLEDVRNFQGVATQLPGSRIIDGRKAYGWQLSTNGMELVLWATEDGMPLEMSMDQGTPLQLMFHFEINLPLPADLFSTRVPQGYSEVAPED